MPPTSPDTHADETHLYHVTSDALADHISTHGLQPVTPEDVMEQVSEDEMETRTERTEFVDTMLEQSRPETVSTDVPRRTNAVYLWTTFDDAQDYAGRSQTILAVDRTAVADTLGQADPRLLAPIEKAIYRRSLFGTDRIYTFAEQDTVPSADTLPSPIRSRIQHFWNTVTTGSNDTVAPNMELWTQTPIPADAITVVTEGGGGSSLPDRQTEPTGAETLWTATTPSALADAVETRLEAVAEEPIDTDLLLDIYLVGPYASESGSLDYPVPKLHLLFDTEPFDLDGITDLPSQEVREAAEHSLLKLRLLTGHLIRSLNLPVRDIAFTPQFEMQPIRTAVVKDALARDSDPTEIGAHGLRSGDTLTAADAARNSPIDIIASEDVGRYTPVDPSVGHPEYGEQLIDYLRDVFGDNLPEGLREE